jgi:hypothetical protein
VEREILVRELRQLRAAVWRLNGEPWSPAVERSLRLADMYFHLALWHLGEVEEVTPELETPAAEA